MAQRDVPFIDAILPALGGMLTGGIFLVPALAADIAGPASILSLLLAAALALAFAPLTVAPLLRPSPLSRHLLGWLGMAARTAAAAALSQVAAAYLVPRGSDGLHNVLAAVLLVISAAVVLAGVKPSASVVAVATGVAVVGLGFYAGLSAPEVTRSAFSPFHPHGWAAVIPAASVLFFLFGGTEFVGVLSPVLARPERNVPFAAALGVAMKAVVALIVLVVSIGVGGQAFTLHRLFTVGEDHAPLLAIAGATGQPAALLALRFAAAVACSVGAYRLLSEAAGAVASLARLRSLPPALAAAAGPREAPWSVLPVTIAAVWIAWAAPLPAAISYAAACLLLGLAVRAGIAAREPGRSGWLWILAAVAAVALAILEPRPWALWAGVTVVVGIAPYLASGLWKTSR